MEMSSHTKESIRQSAAYKEAAETGRYDLTDPMIEGVVCQWAWLEGRIDDCRRILESEGLMVEGLHGNKQNPAQGALKAYMQMQKLALEQARILTTNAPKKGDDLDEFLNGGGDE
jgi:hypothetical protein